MSRRIPDDYAAVDAVAAVPGIPKPTIGNPGDRFVLVNHAHPIYTAATPPKRLWVIDAPHPVATGMSEANRRPRARLADAGH